MISSEDGKKLLNVGGKMINKNGHPGVRFY